MDVGLYDGVVNTQPVAILQPKCNRRLHQQLVDRHERLRRQPHERPLERIVLGHRLAVELCESAQRVAVGDPLAQLAIIPVLDAHQNQRAQHLLRSQPMTASVGVLQTPPKIAPDRLDHLLVVIKKVGDGLQHRFQKEPLAHQLPVGKTDLWVRGSRHVSARLSLGSFDPLALQSLDIARGRLIQQLLKSTPILQAAAYFRHEFLWNVNRKTTPFHTSVQDVAPMLFARQTSLAVLADARASAQAQRAEYRRPNTSRLITQPALDIRR
jgi:hypothetical protein